MRLLWGLLILLNFGESGFVVLNAENAVHDLLGSFFWSELITSLGFIFDKNIALLFRLRTLRFLIGSGTMTLSFLWMLFFKNWGRRESLLLLEH